MVEREKRNQFDEVVFASDSTSSQLSLQPPDSFYLLFSSPSSPLVDSFTCPPYDSPTQPHSFKPQNKSTPCDSSPSLPLPSPSSPSLQPRSSSRPLSLVSALSRPSSSPTSLHAENPASCRALSLVGDQGNTVRSLSLQLRPLETSRPSSLPPLPPIATQLILFVRILQLLVSATVNAAGVTAYVT